MRFANGLRVLALTLYFLMVLGAVSAETLDPRAAAERLSSFGGAAVPFGAETHGSGDAQYFNRSWVYKASPEGDYILITQLEWGAGRDIENASLKVSLPPGAQIIRSLPTSASGTIQQDSFTINVGGGLEAFELGVSIPVKQETGSRVKLVETSTNEVAAWEFRSNATGGFGSIITAGLRFKMPPEYYGRFNIRIHSNLGPISLKNSITSSPSLDKLVYENIRTLVYPDDEPATAAINKGIQLTFPPHLKTVSLDLTGAEMLDAQEELFYSVEPDGARGPGETKGRDKLVKSGSRLTGMNNSGGIGIYVRVKIWSDEPFIIDSLELEGEATEDDFGVGPEFYAKVTVSEEKRNQNQDMKIGRDRDDAVGVGKHTLRFSGLTGRPGKPVTLLFALSSPRGGRGGAFLDRLRLRARRR